MDIAQLITEEARTSAAYRSKWVGAIGGEEVTFYAKPLCAADFEYLAKRGVRDFMVNPTLTGMVEMIIHKAELENGTRVFKPNRDAPIMKKWDQSKIGDIFGELFGEQLEPETEEGFEERVKN